MTCKKLCLAKQIFGRLVSADPFAEDDAVAFLLLSPPAGPPRDRRAELIEQERDQPDHDRVDEHLQKKLERSKSRRRRCRRGWRVREQLREPLHDLAVPSLKKALFRRQRFLIFRPAEDLGQLLLVLVLRPLGGLGFFKLVDLFGDRLKTFADRAHFCAALGRVFFLRERIELVMQPMVIGVDAAALPVDSFGRWNEPTNVGDRLRPVVNALRKPVAIDRGGLDASLIIIKRRRKARNREKQQYQDRSE